MQDLTQNNILYKAMVAAVYSFNTLATLVTYYCEANPDLNMISELKELTENTQHSMKRLAQLIEPVTNANTTASKSIVIGLHTPSDAVQQIINELRNPDDSNI